MATLHLVTVGKLKNSHMQSLEQNYLKRLKFLKFKVHELKPNAENKEKEGEIVLKKLSALNFKQSQLFLLDERGKGLTSIDFSKQITPQNNQDCIFCIGGAEGHADSIKSLRHQSISLSTFTLPHQLARLMFIEQIYRAETILTNHPYHNE